MFPALCCKLGVLRVAETFVYVRSCMFSELRDSLSHPEALVTIDFERISCHHLRKS
jgi:hypothetical protein